MEIVSYVLSGQIEHRDSMGTRGVLVPGEVQRMSAGTGVRHSEFNHSPSEQVHLLQIWILPEKKGVEPSYEQKMFPAEEKQNRLRLVASRDGREGSVKINQDASLYAAVLEPGQTVTCEPQANRYAWVQVAHGAVTVNGKPLSAGDGAAVSGERRLEIQGQSNGAEILLFDLA
jgi:hypothetical protein